MRIDAFILCIEYEHLHPADLVGEYFRGAVALVAEQQRVRAQTVVQILTDAGCGGSGEQRQAENNIRQFHIYVIEVLKDRQGGTFALPIGLSIKIQV